MGGTESKIDDEAVSRYKLRYQFVKEAVSSRNAFAAALAAYTKSLNNTGAALSDYAHTDFFHNTFSFAPAVPAAFSPPPPLHHPPPPPPPPPPLPLRPPPPPPIKIIPERNRIALLEYRHPLQLRREKRRMKNVDGKIEMRDRKPVSLRQIFQYLDDHFLKASEGAREVSVLLEAVKMNFHSNFSDNRGEIDHSKSVMDIITWNRSFHEMPIVDDDDDDSFQEIPSVGDDKYDFNAEETENHATLSDKMLAWEEKLYDEVKAGQIMKHEYQNKVALLNKQKKRGSNHKSVVKLKASICQLHANYIVDMQSVDTIVAEINHLRDDHLYPKLVELVDRMATMWETMRNHHEIQLMYVYALKSLDHSHVQSETSAYHFDRTIQLCEVVRDWHAQFCRLVDYQKDYVKALYSWLKLNLMKEKVCSPLMFQNLPILELIIAWNDDLDKLPDEVARSAISNFSSVTQTIVYLQEEEMKLREKFGATQKELEHKGRQYHIKNGAIEEMDPDNRLQIAKEEKYSVLISLRRRLEEEKEQFQKISRQVRDKSLANLKQHLPELFRALSEFSIACSVMYSNLKTVGRR